jgi:L-lactate dehydrogenase complex protein LldE
MVVDLFIPCYIDQFYPSTAFSVVKILRQVGAEVRYNPEQTCCGQPLFNSGHYDDAGKLAVKFMKDFHQAEVIVTPSASCAGYIRNNFLQLLNGNGEVLPRFSRLQGHIFELSDYLVNEAGITALGAEFPYRVTYHDACSALRDYGIREEPRKLLRSVAGLELVEMKDTETCCGFGGTFSVRFKHISAAMTGQKVENALASGAQYIVSSEASCLMNMEAYIKKNKLPIKTIHLADILARSKR